MIYIKTNDEIKKMMVAGRLLGKIFTKLEEYIKPNISTKELDDLVEEMIRKSNMVPTFKGYQGFPASICASINDEVVHGIPSEKRILVEGDIISIDIGATNEGYVADAARTYAVGNISDDAKNLIEVTKGSFFEGLKYCKENEKLGSVSNAIGEHISKNGYSYVVEFVGHGVGKDMHEDPKIPNYGVSNTGINIKSGMAFAIEPMVNMGRPEIEIDTSDNWTARTKDGSLSAHYENTVIIDKDTPKVITLEN